jgi:SAM-dependent methyltransferase
MCVTSQENTLMKATKATVLGEISLVSPETEAALYWRDDCLISSGGELFPTINGVPRFVPIENYASSFGLQWNTYRRTQLDSYSGVPISRDRLKRIAGGSLDIFKGKTVLEAGCGAGRFTEVMLDSGAKVFAVDISAAVDANYLNFKAHPNYFICQADLLRLPTRKEQFDIVVCLGVIQHTPSPEETMRALCSHVKRGGLLLIDHYSFDYPVTPIRRQLRKYLMKKEEKQSLLLVQNIVRTMWPLHKLLYRMRGIRGVGRIRSLFLRWSPIVDYHDSYSAVGNRLLYEWAALDTYDTLTDYYKHLRSADEIHECLARLGLVGIEVSYGGNGVEARALKAANA